VCVWSFRARFRVASSARVVVTTGCYCSTKLGTLWKDGRVYVTPLPAQERSLEAAAFSRDVPLGYGMAGQPVGDAPLGYGMAGQPVGDAPLGYGMAGQPVVGPAAVAVV